MPARAATKPPPRALICKLRGRRTPLRCALTGSAYLLAFAGGQAAIAQQSDAGDAREEPETVLVTGSRLQTSGMNTPTPVTAIDAEELSLIAPNNVIEALNQLPQFYGNNSPNEPGFFHIAPGAGNLNMRGLGVNRTLTLLDGRRIVSSTRQGSVDINLFPEALLADIEIVTGGASAAYGTDAVAGVVNFKLDTNFTGVAGHAQAGITSRGDGENYEISLTLGGDLGERGHILFSTDYFNQEEIAGFEGRDWYQGWGVVTNPDPAGPDLIIAPNVVSTLYTDGGLIVQPGSSLNRLMFLSDGSYTPFVQSDLSAIGGSGSQSITNGGSGYNAGADPYVTQLATGNDRGTIFAYADYDLTNDLNVFAQGIYGATSIDQVNTPAAMFPPIWQATVYRDNAYLPETIRQIMIDEGLQSFGFSRYASSADLATNRAITDSDLISLTVGFKAELPAGLLQGWTVDGYYQYGTVQRDITQAHWIRSDRLFASLDAVRDPATGAIVCRAKLLGNPGYQDCVPANFFGAGNVSREAIDYITAQNDGAHTVTTPLYISTPSGDGYVSGITETYTVGGDKVVVSDTDQDVFELSANGEIWKGWGAGPVLGAFGGGHRKESVYQLVKDASNISSDPTLMPAHNDPATGLQGVPTGYTSRPTGSAFSSFPNLKGDYSVTEAFVETLVPVFANFPFAQQVNVNLAARWADYTGSGSIWSWKYGVDWQMTQALRLRGTASRDIRAATLSERFDRQGTGLSVNDPEFGGQNFAVGGVIGGNPDVAPEEADTVTAGVIYQPTWLDGFSFSGDWYSIEISGAIGQLGPQRIVDDCLKGAEALCALIERDPETNIILEIQNTFQNINQAKVAGVDIEMRYDTDISLLGGGAEDLTARFIGSWLGENSTTNVGAPKLDEAGEIGLNDLPEYRLIGNLTYNNGPWSLFAQERWISSGVRDAAHVEGIDINDNTVDDVLYTDLNVTYRIQTDERTYELFGNVTNLFDTDPPIAASFSSFGGATQVNRSLHDALGRRYVGGIRFRW